MPWARGARQVCSAGRHIRRMSTRSRSGSSEPLAIGQAYETERVFSQAEVDAFLSLTGDTNAIHRHTSAAQSLGFHAPVLPGMLGASLFPAIVGSTFPGSVYFGQTLRFLKPLYVGQPVRARVEVLEMKQLKGTQLKVVFRTQLLSSGEKCGEVHTDGEATAVMPAQARLA
mmetsp:Transcript_35546/g.100617  ORF Transcript_35546/g.100617 Transcript_35546/m.100617 type:complete len:171 (-) Transcript_35546:311-823(-)